MKSTLISDLQLKNREASTTSQLQIERLINENNHLNEELAEIQKQFELERKAIREKLCAQLEEAAKGESAHSERLYPAGQLREKDREIEDLKQELTEKCSTIELLIQRVR